MIGLVQENRWRTIAADIDGVPQPEKINQVRIEREAMFAYRAEAGQWVAEQETEGFSEAFISGAAVRYFGPTDAPSNCWMARVERLADPENDGNQGE